MNRYQYLEKELFRLLENKSHGFYKRLAYSHLFQVETLCIFLAHQRDLDVELSAIIGLFHDVSIAIDCNDFNHAARSAAICKNMMNDSQLFTPEEIELVVNAIKTHSQKETVGDPYCEMIKDADVIAHLYNGNALKEVEKQRLTKVPVF